MDVIQDNILADLEELDDGLSRMEYLLACARQAPGIPPEQRREEDLLPDCQARTWVIPVWRDGRLSLRSDSESFLIQGVLALLTELYEGRTAGEIARFSCRLIDHPALADLLTIDQRRGLSALLLRLSGAGEEVSHAPS